MIARLGNLALDLDIPAGRAADAMLFDDAIEMARHPAQPMRVRANLVLLGLSAAELRGATIGLAQAAGYQVDRMAPLVADLITRLGGDPKAAPEALAAALKAMRDTQAAPEPARAPAAPRTRQPAIEDPYPGLTRRGETWAHVATRLSGDRSLAADNERAEWGVAGEHVAKGEIAAWVADVGGALGFCWEG